MTATKVKPNEVIGDDLPILKWQINRIMKNAQYQVDTKNEWVQWVTADVNRTSLKSITQAQAKKIIMAQEGSTPINQPKDENWAVFDKNNPKHKVILSLLYQALWVKPNGKWGEVPDIERLSTFLQSDKSPVQKKLKDMEPEELEKLIKALSGIVKSTYK
ncbi:hypothetical protein [Flavobacterium maritimum]|uniref:hypothetical protein n=1 Tax=Flavobacterium maritimum TaxID=3149042 RepID=UPI0032B425E1